MDVTVEYVSTTSNYDRQVSNFNSSVIDKNNSDVNSSASQEIYTEDFALNDTLTIDSDDDVTKVDNDVIGAKDDVRRTLGDERVGVNQNISRLGAPENPPYMNSESAPEGMAVEVFLLLNRTNVSKAGEEGPRPKKETTDDEDLLTDYGSGDDSYEDDYDERAWQGKGGRRRNKD